MKAILTKHLADSPYSGGQPERVSAYDSDGNKHTLTIEAIKEAFPKTTPWTTENIHRAVAVELCVHMGWTHPEKLVGGEIKAGQWAFVWPQEKASKTVPKSIHDLKSGDTICYKYHGRLELSI